MVKSTNRISDQDFTFGVLVIICASGVAFILIATLKLHIATLKLSDDSDSDSDSDSESEKEQDQNNRFSLRNFSKSKKSSNSSDNVHQKVEHEGGEKLNDGLEEHGYDATMAAGRRRAVNGKTTYIQVMWGN